ncbi:MAG: aminoacyl-tRNA hydrolase [Saprospiraceae bacterium]|nr:aminoacyl-tRNA hydrolase [Saprospiraceae bacterium]
MENEIPDLTPECTFNTSRSSGPGGQHVNKTETKVELRFNIIKSELLSDKEKNLLLTKLKHRLVDDDSSILLSAQETRSQLKNKVLVIKKLHDLIKESLKEDEPRLPTKPTKASNERRIAEKKQSGDIKSKRGKVKPTDWEE